MESQCAAPPQSHALYTNPLDAPVDLPFHKPFSRNAMYAACTALFALFAMLAGTQASPSSSPARVQFGLAAQGGVAAAATPVEAPSAQAPAAQVPAEGAPVAALPERRKLALTPIAHALPLRAVPSGRAVAPPARATKPAVLAKSVKPAANTPAAGKAKVAVQRR